MSINLTLTDKDTGLDIDLWQTPTFITWMCLSYNLETKEPDGGHDGVRRRYEEWVKSHTTGKWDSSEDLEYMTERINDHLSTIKNVKNPEFSFI
jgi:hypothetical protein